MLFWKYLRSEIRNSFSQRKKVRGEFEPQELHTFLYFFPSVLAELDQWIWLPLPPIKPQILPSITTFLSTMLFPQPLLAPSQSSLRLQITRASLAPHLPFPLQAKYCTQVFPQTCPSNSFHLKQIPWKLTITITNLLLNKCPLCPLYNSEICSNIPNTLFPPLTTTLLPHPLPPLTPITHSFLHLLCSPNLSAVLPMGKTVLLMSNMFKEWNVSDIWIANE